MAFDQEDLDSADTSTMSKSERKKYKKLLKEKQKLEAQNQRESEKKRKSMMKWAIFIGIVVVIGIFVKVQADRKREFLLHSPSILISPTNVDMGTISAANGKVQAHYKVTNTGENDLSISNMVSSCMCTTANLRINGRESPTFGMHNNVPWTGKIAPGETADLVVTFDPNFHANTRGEITRFVNFNTNDPSNPQQEVRLKTFVTA